MRLPPLTHVSSLAPRRPGQRPSRHGVALLASALSLAWSAGLIGCGGDATPEVAPSASASTTPPAAPASAASAAPAPTVGPTAAPAPAALPEPVAPATWNTTMGELTVDGVTVRDVSATCGMFAMMPVVQVIAGATASCPDRAGVTVHASFEGGQLRAVAVTGAGADCVRRAVVAASTGVSCQFQLTFGG